MVDPMLRSYQARLDVITSELERARAEARFGDVQALELGAQVLRSLIEEAAAASVFEGIRTG